MQPIATRFGVGWRRIVRIWRGETEKKVDEELRFHFEQKVAEFVASGLSPDEARARADDEFGDIASVRASLIRIDERVEKWHRRAAWWESVAQDLRYVVRTLRRLYRTLKGPDGSFTSDCRNLLHEVSPHDPLVFGVAATTLLMVAVSACMIPAWRVSRVDPLSAMRSE